MIQVIIIEDNHDIRNAIHALVNGSSGFCCTAVYSNAEEALAAIPGIDFHVALVDINLPGMSGIELISQLKPIMPEKQFIMLTVFEDIDYIFNALKAGATGYLVKSTPPAKILEAIVDVHQGGSPMSGQIARKVISSFNQTTTAENPCINCLSKREQEILTLLSKGFRYKEIATQLFISIETVRTHIRNIYQKLQVESGIEAINKAFGTKLQ